MTFFCCGFEFLNFFGATFFFFEIYAVAMGVIFFLRAPIVMFTSSIHMSSQSSIVNGQALHNDANSDCMPIHYIQLESHRKVDLEVVRNGRRL
jgi:hypothetical protein